MDFDYFPPTDPIFAIIYILLFVGLISIFFRYYFKYLTDSKKTSDKKLIVVLAEVLGAIGLIGLITFSGRAKISSEAYQSEILNAKATAALNKSIKDILATSLCTSAVMPADVEEDSVNGLCTFLQKYERERNLNIQWSVAKRAANTITDRLLVSGNIAAGLATFNVVNAIKEFQDTRSKVSRSKFNEFFLKIQDSWLFLTACAVLAGLGVSIKVARAYIDWRDDKDECFNLKKPSNT